MDDILTVGSEKEIGKFIREIKEEGLKITIEEELKELMFSIVSRVILVGASQS